MKTVEADIAILVCGFFILIGLWNPIGFDERRAEAHDALPYSIRLGSIALWWLVPIALIFAFGLFKESYLKFFIVIAIGPRESNASSASRAGAAAAADRRLVPRGARWPPAPPLLT